MEYYDENHKVQFVPVFLNLHPDSNEEYDENENEINMIPLGKLHSDVLENDLTVEALRQILFNGLNEMYPNFEKNDMELFIERNQSDNRIYPLDRITLGEIGISEESAFHIDYHGTSTIPLPNPSAYFASNIARTPPITPPRTPPITHPRTPPRTPPRRPLRIPTRLNTRRSSATKPQSLLRKFDELSPKLDATVGKEALSREGSHLIIKNRITGEQKRVDHIRFNTSSISSVKHQIKNVFGKPYEPLKIPNKNIILRKRDKSRLPDNFDTLEELGLKSGDTLDMTIQIRTGYGGTKRNTKKSKNKTRKNRKFRHF
jgi:hypothetical protein